MFFFRFLPTTWPYKVDSSGCQHSIWIRLVLLMQLRNLFGLQHFGKTVRTPKCCPNIVHGKTIWCISKSHNYLYMYLLAMCLHENSTGLRTRIVECYDQNSEWFHEKKLASNWVVSCLARRPAATSGTNGAFDAASSGCGIAVSCKGARNMGKKCLL